MFEQVVLLSAEQISHRGIILLLDELVVTLLLFEQVVLLSTEQISHRGTVLRTASAVRGASEAGERILGTQDIMHIGILFFCSEDVVHIQSVAVDVIDTVSGFEQAADRAVAVEIDSDPGLSSGKRSLVKLLEKLFLVLLPLLALLFVPVPDLDIRILGVVFELLVAGMKEAVRAGRVRQTAQLLLSFLSLTEGAVQSFEILQIEPILGLPEFLAFFFDRVQSAEALRILRIEASLRFDLFLVSVLVFESLSGPRRSSRARDRRGHAAFLVLQAGVLRAARRRRSAAERCRTVSFSFELYVFRTCSSSARFAESVPLAGGRIAAVREFFDPFIGEQVLQCGIAFPASRRAHVVSRDLSEEGVERLARSLPDRICSGFKTEHNGLFAVIVRLNLSRRHIGVHDAGDDRTALLDRGDAGKNEEDLCDIVDRRSRPGPEKCDPAGKHQRNDIKIDIDRNDRPVSGNESPEKCILPLLQAFSFIERHRRSKIRLHQKEQETVEYPAKRVERQPSEHDDHHDRDADRNEPVHARDVKILQNDIQPVLVLPRSFAHPEKGRDIIDDPAQTKRHFVLFLVFVHPDEVWLAVFVRDAVIPHFLRGLRSFFRERRRA